MGHHQRQGVDAVRTCVDEVDVEAIDLSGELRKSVEARFARAPVVGVGPVLGDLAYVGERDALLPVVDRLGFGKPRAAKASLQVLDLVDR